jgi:alpha-L-fucosidase 2
LQIDADLGTPRAMIELVLYSRPGHGERLPALPSGRTTTVAYGGTSRTVTPMPGESATLRGFVR